MKNTFIAIKFITVMTIITGVLYPIFVTGVAQVLFSDNANGKLIKNKNSKCIGSELIGQDFKQEKYFQPRPSATGYNPIPSGGTNFGPTNKNLSKESASGSGLDPHISPDAAIAQIPRIAKIRKLNEVETNRLKNLVKDSIEHRQFKILGEERVNVLLLNIKTDEEFAEKDESK